MFGRAARVRWFAVLAATLLALYVCWLIVKPLFGVLAWAAVLATVFYPVHRRIAARTKRRNLAALASCLIVVIVFVVPAALVVWALVHEVTNQAQGWQANFDRLRQGGGLLPASA